ncbi:MAG: A/G-specific adenine glycosylase [Candidatus Campbellbacteria bacterium]|nr:A/G-specific adenine glycosylase [Candidatus Campbellbacteria bacterium]
MKLSVFKKAIWKYYQTHGRILPWRKTHDPYKILVSEIMLQQTQVDHVIPKYSLFVKKFNSFKVLANAKTSDVIKAWQGLGYNRRALNLQRAAREIVQKHNSKLPSSYSELVSLPGIGPYTAGALLAFAYNKPVVCIETNIRSVFLTHFADLRRLKRKSTRMIHDKELLPLIEKTLDHKNPREWYWALMDYGSHLKKTLPNPSRKSTHHTKQKPFNNSNRQLRGNILKLVSQKNVSEKTLFTRIQRKPIEIRRVLKTLKKEGFIKRQGKNISLV